MRTNLLIELTQASTKSKRAIAASCSNQTLRTGTEHLAAMERRLSGLVEALKIFQPIYQRFYASLDDRQKRLIDGLGPGRRGWRW